MVYNFAHTIEQAIIHAMLVGNFTYKHFALVDKVGRLTHITTTKAIPGLTIKFGPIYVSPLIPQHSPNTLAVSNITGINLQKINLYLNYHTCQHFLKNDWLAKQIMDEKPLGARIVETGVRNFKVSTPKTGLASSKTQATVKIQKSSFFEHYGLPENTDKVAFLETRIQNLLTSFNMYGCDIDPRQSSDCSHVLERIEHFTQVPKIAQLLASVQVHTPDGGSGDLEI